MTEQMQRPGGRTNRTREAVLAAAYDVVAAQGYDGLTVDAIAERSGVHKTTIYRRWKTADDVLFDAVVARAEDAIPLERTGDALADLRSMAVAVAENLANPISAAVAAATLSRPENDRVAQLTERFWVQRLDAASAIVAAGQAEGTIDADLDPRVVIERIVGPIWFRVMVLRAPVDEDFIDAVVYAVA
jgi:AcrR family transcriptional regulator